MLPSNTSRVPREALRISSIERPGWHSAEGEVPSVGDYVYCLEGPAKVTKLLGRTSDGSRLLELQCEDRRHPFFASSANVLLRTTSENPPVTHQSQEAESED